MVLNAVRLAITGCDVVIELTWVEIVGEEVGRTHFRLFILTEVPLLEEKGRDNNCLIIRSIIYHGLYIKEGFPLFSLCHCKS